MEEILSAVALMGGLGVISAGLLYIAARAFYVYEDPRIEEIANLLPGSNCGGCGLPGCKALAEMLVKGEPGARCPVCSASQLEVIGKALGRDLGKAAPQVAVLLCKGDAECAKHFGSYHGIRDCRAAHLMGTAEKLCPYGCIGLGTCIEVCPTGAIRSKGAIVEVLREKCIGCGLCVAICPRDILQLVPAEKDVIIACRSNDKGPIVSEYCSVGCIACRKCVKECPFEAISIVDNLAVIDFEKCTACGRCVAVCPQHTIDALFGDIDRTDRLPKTSGAGSEQQATTATGKSIESPEEA